MFGFISEKKQRLKNAAIAQSVTDGVGALIKKYKLPAEAIYVFAKAVKESMEESRGQKYDEEVEEHLERIKAKGAKIDKDRKAKKKSTGK